MTSLLLGAGGLALILLAAYWAADRYGLATVIGGLVLVLAVGRAMGF